MEPMPPPPLSPLADGDLSPHAAAASDGLPHANAAARGGLFGDVDDSGDVGDGGEYEAYDQQPEAPADGDVGGGGSGGLPGDGREPAGAASANRREASSCGRSLAAAGGRVVDAGNALLDSRAVTVALLLLTLYILFANDVRIIAFTSEVDPVFEVLSSVCLFVFAAELLLRSLLHTTVTVVDVEAPLAAREAPAPGRRPPSAARRALNAAWRAVCCGRRRKVSLSGYFLSFLFCLDVIATVSLLPEIGWIWAGLAGGATASGSGGGSQQLSTARASRISRLGSRIGRIIRMVRVVRLFKLYTLWRRAGGNAVKASAGGAAGASPRGALTGSSSSSAGGDDASSAAPPGVRESQMGQRLADATTRTVILLVLAMLLLIPLFVYTPDAFGHEEGALLIHSVNTWRGPQWEVTVGHVEDVYRVWRTAGNGMQPSDDGAPQLVKVALSPSAGVPPALLIDLPYLYNTLRDGSSSLVELQTFRYEAPAPDGSPNNTVVTDVWYNMRPVARQDALDTLGLTIFIIFLLLVGALQFSADAQALVLRPIEGMIAFVERISFDGKGGSAAGTSASSGGGSGGGDSGAAVVTSRDNTGSYETKVLENTIKKIVSVLRVGFGGTAGMAIVARHLGPAPPAPPPTAPAPKVLPTASPAAGAAIGPVVPPAPARAEPAAGAPTVVVVEPPPQTAAPAPAAVDPPPASSSSQPTSASLIISGGGGSSSRAAASHHYSQQQPAMQQQQQQRPSLFDPYRRGRVVHAVFVSVTIPHAGDIVEALQEEALPYLNRVAKVVHDTALAWGGAVVSNSHAGYDLVWTVGDDDAGASDGGGDAGGRGGAGSARGAGSVTDGDAATGRDGTVGGNATFGRRGRRVSLASLALAAGDASAGASFDADATAGADPISGSSSYRSGAGAVPTDPSGQPLSVSGASSIAGSTANHASTRRRGGVPWAAMLRTLRLGGGGGGGGAAAGDGGEVAQPSPASPTQRPRSRRRSTALESLQLPPLAAPGSQGDGGSSSPQPSDGGSFEIPAPRQRSRTIAATPVATATATAAAAPVSSPAPQSPPPPGEQRRRRRSSLTDLVSSVLRLPLHSVGGAASGGGASPASGQQRSRSASAAAAPGQRARRASQQLQQQADAASEAADRALIACLKTIAALRRSRDVQESPEAVYLRRSLRLAGHRLPALQFGLHAGWAVEGAIGSAHRVDPLCVGGHVTAARALAALGTEFGAPVVMSSRAHRLLSGAPRRLCRPLDSVQLVPPGGSGEDASALPTAAAGAASSAASSSEHAFSVYAFDVWDWGASARPAQLVANVRRQLAARAAGRGPAAAAQQAAAAAQLASGAAALSVTYAGADGAAPPALLPFAALTAASPAGRRAETDVFNVAQRFTPDADRRISILGAADIIEHPVQPGAYDRGLFDANSSGGGGDPELWALRAPFSDEFRAAHAKAVASYVAGRWDAAAAWLERASALLPGSDTVDDGAAAASSGDGGGGGGPASTPLRRAAGLRDPAARRLLDVMQSLSQRKAAAPTAASNDGADATVPAAAAVAPPPGWTGRRDVVLTAVGGI